jgi:hypothetical protein
MLYFIVLEEGPPMLIFAESLKTIVIPWQLNQAIPDVDINLLV